MGDHTRDYGTDSDMESEKVSPEAREMIKWFLQNYEDPVESCPFDSEDGYEFVYGGPYYAIDELVSQYGDSLAAEEAARYLDEMCVEWSAMPGELEDDFIPDTEEIPDTEDVEGDDEHL